MEKRIIFPNEYGISILVPTGDLPFDEVCRKDVPAGVPYIIVEVSDIPEDREFRGAWEVDFSNPDGYGIGAEAWFAMQTTEETEVQE
jgi:hypothetical protein